MSEWISLDEVIPLLKKFKKTTWAKWSRAKYIELRIDTRDMYCLIKDRDGKEINLIELKRRLK